LALDDKVCDMHARVSERVQGADAGECGNVTCISPQRPAPVRSIPPVKTAKPGFDVTRM